MSEWTGIAWTNFTWNPWIGCMKVSAGCKNCYAASLDARYYGGTHWGKGAARRRTSAATWTRPVGWNKRAQKRGECYRVFPSLCDWLDEEVPIEWLADFLKLVHETPNLDWLLLTKRPENFVKRIKSVWDYQKDHTISLDGDFWVGPPENVWVGVSVEDQERADERIPLLLQIPAKVRFLSVEPLLERVDLTRCCADEAMGVEYNALTGRNWSESPLPPIHWVIVGGESGAQRRDCGVEAICDVARQCEEAGVPVFVKQDCSLMPGCKGRLPDEIWGLKEFPKRQ